MGAQLIFDTENCQAAHLSLQLYEGAGNNNFVSLSSSLIGAAGTRS